MLPGRGGSASRKDPYVSIRFLQRRCSREMRRSGTWNSVSLNPLPSAAMLPGVATALGVVGPKVSIRFLQRRCSRASYMSTTANNMSQSASFSGDAPGSLCATPCAKTHIRRGFHKVPSSVPFELLSTSPFDREIANWPSLSHGWGDFHTAKSRVGARSQPGCLENDLRDQVGQGFFGARRRWA
jgi:hypothetical protein